MKGANATYWSNIGETFTSLWTGLKLAFGHLGDARHMRKPVGVEHPEYFIQDKGIVTLQYPYETLPLPDNARYRLHNEIDDCIVCDKCAKICPVDCIEIEVIKSPEEIGKTSDGTPKRLHAARFDIDMAKCCFCGLCTTVCPTECLTMTKAYDFSEFDVKDHTYAFAEMTPLQILEAQQKLEEAENAKLSAKMQQSSPQKEAVVPLVANVTPDTVNTATLEATAEKAAPASTGGRPVFKPRIPTPKPTGDQKQEEKTEDIPQAAASAAPENAAPDTPKPTFRPKVVVKAKPITRKESDG